MRATTALLLLLATSGAAADEGMWTFDSFPSDKVRAAYGFSPDAAWLENVRLASARLASCSASFVSADGLVVTNHHCARGCVADNSTAARNYIEDGFSAAKLEDEARCPREHIDQLLEIRDVTPEVTAALRGQSGEGVHRALAAATGRIEAACQAEARTHCEVVSLYQGGLYHLYRYHRYDDVRLVFAPEESIAFFGGDPDNYEYPRWNLDVSFMRVYEDGKPAHPSRFFHWSKGGAREGELIFIAGSPGKTSRLLTVAQLEHARDLVLPEELFLMAEQRGFLAELQRRGPEERRIAEDKLFGISNYFKRERGQRELLVDPDFFARKVADERALRDGVAASPELAARYGGAWDAIAGAVQAFRPLRTPYIYLEGAKYAGRLPTPKGFDSRLFVLARALLRHSTELGKPDGDRLDEMQDAALPSVTQEMLSTAPIYPALETATLAFSLGKLREELGPDHPLARRLLARETPDELAARVVGGTRLGDVALRRKLWESGKLAGVADPMLELARAVEPEARAVRAKVEQVYDGALAREGEKVARARFEKLGRTVAPDGTFTPRLAYGAVRGVTLDGVKIPATTTVARLYERATGKPPFALPERWVEARGRLRPDLPFNAIGTPDTTGGNSGSPVLNRAAEVVGVYFDQNVYGTASAYGYDERRRRGVFVHSELVIEALRTVYGAERLVKELGR